LVDDRSRDLKAPLVQERCQAVDGSGLKPRSEP
jgi:hypothetical protein